MTVNNALVKEQQLETPVLFIVFNRPDTTKIVFEAIRKARPKKLFIAADAPRYPLKKEYELCEQVRNIAQQVDWSCEVKTLFQETNLGVGRGGVEGINWFFEHVESGIILEDDCVPSEEFFQFCAQGLKKFEHDASVMMLGGTSYLLGGHSNLQGYYRSSFYSIWGWATWRRAWQSYSYDISSWGVSVTYRDLKIFFGNVLIAQRWARMFDDIKNHRLEAWDIQWVFACVKNHGYSLAIPFNMISNVGMLGGHSNGDKHWVHEMLYQKANINRCLDQELSITQSKNLDFEVYTKLGFLYREPKYKIIGRFLLKKVPLAKLAYGYVKIFLNIH